MKSPGPLAQAKVPVTDQERDGMLALARPMKLDDLVAPRAGVLLARR